MIVETIAADMSQLHQVRALLFDKDGTILDYWRTWIPVNRAVATYAAQGDAGLRDRVLEVGGQDPVTNHVAPSSLLAAGTVDEIVAMAHTVAGTVAPNDLRTEAQRLFQEACAAHGVLIDGARETLVELKARGVPLGLATNDTEGGLVSSLDKFGLWDLFEFTCGADSGFGAKPGPGMVHAFCDAVGLHAKHTAVVGDSTHDLEMARRAGAQAIAVLSGTGTVGDLCVMADLVVDSVVDLLSVFSGI